ncbi:MAG: hypothetical protein K2I29_01475, partial [Clostridia bacterium]|nr:hypothetical protein [Clostridia bacterium]
MKIKKVKTKIASAILMFALAICAVFGAFFGTGTDTANATATGTSYSLGTGGSFTAANLTNLMGKIMGSSTAKSYNELKAYMDKDADHARTGTEIDAQVTLGGQVWNVVYASETKGGDVIATLWLAESDNTQQWNDWGSDDSTSWDYPSNMYSTSKIRSHIVGSSYASAPTTSPTSLQVTLTDGTQSATWKNFITNYSDYIATPAEVAWQENECSTAVFSPSYQTYPNDAYGTPSIVNWNSAQYDYSTKAGYSNWQYDKLWIPSVTETGHSATNIGLWEISATVRANDKFTWLRSGYNMYARLASALNRSGDFDNASTPIAYAVRPAFHLNLKSASAAAGLIVDKPNLSAKQITFSELEQTFVIPSTVNLDVELPINWTLSSNTVTVPKNAPAGTYNINISPKAGYGWSDGSVGTLYLPVQILPTANGKYTVIWEGVSSVMYYNGAEQTPGAYIISGGEKLSVSVSVEKWDGSAWVAATSAKDVGEYRFKATKTDYALLNDTAECRIDPRVISVEYANLTGLTHGAVDANNKPLTVTASTKDPVARAERDAGLLNFAVTGGSNLAGTWVVSTVAQVKDGANWVDSENYVISNATAVQTVGKKVLSDNDITWSPNGLTFTYDGNVKIPAGTVKTAALAGGDSGSVYVIFEFVYAVEVGTYQVKVLGLSNDNYTYSGTKTVTIVAEDGQSVQWEGVQNGGTVNYNGENQLPKPYIVIGGEKIYLEIDSLTRDGVAVGDKTTAIVAGEYVATVDGVSSGNYKFASATLTFTVAPMELKAIYLTQNVYIYSGSNPFIEVYALGANNEKIVITNRTVTKDGASASLMNYSDAGSYAVTVASGVLGSNPNYMFTNALTTTFVVNPLGVTVAFKTAGNNWVWRDGKNSEITVTASVPNSVEVKYGNFGSVNVQVADNGSGTFVIAANAMTNLGGNGIIEVTTVNGNYQITGQSFQTFEIVSSATTATAEFKLDGVAWATDGMSLTYDETNGKAISVTGSDGVDVKYYKDGVLMNSPITTTAGLAAGNYLITVSCATREVKTNVNDLARSFTVTPKEVDFAGVEWL